MRSRGALSLFAAGDILRDNFLHLLLLPACPQFKYFPILNLQSPPPHCSGHNGAFHGGNSLHYTVGRRGGQGGGDWRCQRQQCRPILSTGLALIYCRTFWPPPIYLLCFDIFILWFCFLAIFLKLSQIICPPSLPPGYEHSNQFYLLDCSPVPQQSAPEIQPFLFQILPTASLNKQDVETFKFQIRYKIFLNWMVKYGPSFSFVICDLQRVGMGVKEIVVLLNLQRGCYSPPLAPPPHQPYLLHHNHFKSWYSSQLLISE